MSDSFPISWHWLLYTVGLMDETIDCKILFKAVLNKAIVF